MEHQDFVRDLIAICSLSGAFVFVFSGAIWLLKVSIEAAIKRSADLTIRKAELASSREIALINAGIKAAEITRQVSYPEIYKKQFDLIDQLYNSLLEFQQISIIVVGAIYEINKEEEFREKYYSTWHAMRNAFYRTSIYLPKSLGLIYVSA